MDCAKNISQKTWKEIRIYVFLSICIILNSCSYDFPIIPEEPEPTIQEIDLTNVIFIGSTAFSGINDGVLVPEKSLNSIPQIFINTLQGKEITTDISATSGNEIGFNIYENFNLSGTIGPYKLQYPSSADTSFFQKPIAGEPHNYLPQNEGLKNFSFPQAQILDFTEPNRFINPYIPDYFENNNESLMNKLVEEAPSFFVLDLGLDDIFGYAFNGAEGENNNSSISNIDYQDILDPTIFEQKLKQFTDVLISSNSDAKGVVFNIPDFLKFPFFIKSNYDITPFICIPSGTFIHCTPTNRYDEVLTEAREFSRKVTEYYTANPQIPFEARRKGLDFEYDVRFNWGVLVEDNNLPDVFYQGEAIPRIRHMLRDEIIFYRNESYLAQTKGYLPSNALTEQDYLKTEDIAEIESQIEAYNQAIANVVAQSNGDLILFDINAYFDTLFSGLNSFLDVAANGELIEGAPFLPTLGKFGIFSADGINLNPRGNALITNQLIELLNESFGGNLKKVNPNDFASTQFIISNE